MGNCFDTEEDALYEDVVVIREVLRNSPDRVRVKFQRGLSLSREDFILLCHGLTRNTHVKELILRNMGLTNVLALYLRVALKKNRTVEVLDLRGNFFTALGVLAILRSISGHRRLKQVWFGTQLTQDLTVQDQIEIAKMVEMSKSLRLLNIGLTHRESFERVQNHIYRGRRHQIARDGNNGVVLQHSGVF